MGEQARRRRQQRAALREHYGDMRDLSTRLRATVATAEVAADAWDDECAALRDAPAPDQRERLHAAGWRLHEPNRDGIGKWIRRDLSLIHSLSREVDGQVWAHVSVATSKNTMPTWYEVRNAGWLLYPGRFGIVVIAPDDQHVNIANVAHVWYCLTAQSCPDFSRGLGTI